MSRPSLLELLGVAPVRAQVVSDAVQTLELEVKDKSGLGGLAVKAAFAVVTGIKPGILREVVDRLLDDFLRALDPFYQSALDQGLSAGGLVVPRKSEVAAALLQVADAKARKAPEPLRKAYEKLRPSAEKHVEAAAPRLGALLDKHAKPS